MLFLMIFPFAEYIQNLGRGTRNWCNIAYWELMQRVGRMYNATSEWVDVYLEFFCHMQMASALANYQMKRDQTQ